MPKGTCKVGRCRTRAMSTKSGMCETHYNRKKRGEPLIRPCAICHMGDMRSKAIIHPECGGTCQAPLCDRASRKPGVLYCTTHHERAKAGAPLIRPCAVCGEGDMRGKGEQFHPECEPSACSLSHCDRPVDIALMCSMHYQRKRDGRPLLRPCSVCGEGDLFTSSPRHDDCPGECFIEGCNKEVRYGSMCSTHRSRHYNGLPTDYPCAQCGSPVSQGSRTLCDGCDDPSRRRKYLNRPEAIRALVERDGTGCALCATPIPMGSQWPSPDSPSIDHVHPVSLGGTNDMPNLALAHLRCNIAKGNKIEAMEPAEPQASH